MRVLVREVVACGAYVFWTRRSQARRILIHICVLVCNVNIAAMKRTGGITLMVPPEGYVDTGSSGGEADPARAARAGWAASYPPALGLLRRAVAGCCEPEPVEGAAVGIAHACDTMTVMLVGVGGCEWVFCQGFVVSSSSPYTSHPHQSPLGRSPRKVPDIHTRATPLRPCPPPPPHAFTSQ